MKIDRLEVINLRFEYAQGFTYAGGTCTARVTTLVLVHTADGRVGVGAAYTHPAVAWLLVRDQFEPLLVGRDPRDVEALWDLMYRTTRWFGRKGVTMTVLGAIDTALWDLRGQDAHKPLWQLLGGATSLCPAYGSALLWKEPQALAEEAGRLIDAGFRRVKMRLGLGPEKDEAAVRAVRQAIGDSCDLMVDGSMRYDLEGAARLARLLEEQRVFWFEEPFEPEELETFAALRARVKVPLAAGENEFGLQGFREMIRVGAVDIVQPDASRCGGISELRRVAELTRPQGLRVATHSWSDPVAIIANAHVVAAADNGLTVEVDQSGNPWISELLAEPLRVTDGQLDLGHAPGLGIALNAEAVARYRVPDPLHMPPGVYSDMVFLPTDRTAPAEEAP